MEFGICSDLHSASQINRGPPGVFPVRASFDFHLKITMNFAYEFQKLNLKVNNCKLKIQSSRLHMDMLLGRDETVSFGDYLGDDKY